MSVEHSGDWALGMGREYLGAAGVVTIKGSNGRAVYPVEPLGAWVQRYPRDPFLADDGVGRF